MFFPTLRKRNHRMDEDDCWRVLAGRDTEYGYLGTHGIQEQNPFPYIIPMNFAADFNERALYIHTTIDEDSRRNASLAENPAVCFTVTAPDSKIVFNPTETMACKTSMSFRSVIVFGNVSEILDAGEKRRILLFMFEQKVMPDSVMNIDELILSVTRIYKIDVENIQGARKVQSAPGGRDHTILE